MARPGRELRARRGVTQATKRVALSAPWIDERDEELVLETLRSGCLSLGPTGPRFEELLAEKPSARATAPPSRAAPPALHLGDGARRRRAGRRGDHLAVLVRRVGELRDLRGRDAGLRRHRPAHVQPRSRGGRGGDHRADEGDRRRRHLRLSVRARPAARASASGTGSRSSRTRARRSARGTRDGRSARTAIRRRSRSTRTSR